MDKEAMKLALIRDQYIDLVIGKEIFPSVTSIPQADNPIAIVCDFFLRKATKTLDAICILSEAGFAEDALVLGRTIFELSLHLHTIAAADSIEQQRHKALCFIFDGERQRAAKREEMAHLKEQGECLSWIDEIEASNSVPELIEMPIDFVQPPSNLKDMASKLATDTMNAEEWTCWYHFLYWSISKLAHPSGIGSRTYVQACDMDAEALRAIILAVTMHYSLTGCALRMLGLETLQPKLDECIKTLLELEASKEFSQVNNTHHQPNPNHP